jgi:two-component system heavy metal sensor histidine kinase CusS
MHSLRARLLIGVIGGMILLLTVFSLLLYGVIAGALRNQFDASLLSAAQMLAASVEHDGDEIELEFEAEQMPRSQDTRSRTYYKLWGPDGTVIAKSPLPDMLNLRRLDGALKAPAFATSKDKHGQTLRTVCLQFVPRGADSDEKVAGQPAVGPTVTLVVARDAGGFQDQLRFLRWLLLVASAVVIVLSLLIAVLVVGHGLRPLNAIAAEIAAIRENDLTARIGAQHVPAEAAPIKNRLNELLSRLEASFHRERQFNADVAHELRTPLAGIRSTIEVTLARPRDATEYQAALSDCLEITQSMQSVVNNLLMLTRLNTQRIGFKTERIQLAELVDSCWRPFADRANERRVAFQNRIAAEMIFPSDREHMSMVFANLLANATEYADEGGCIWTTARRASDGVEIEVSNTGCQLTAEQVSRVLDCFWRGDSARSDTGAHCGLGLALVQRLARALGGNTVAELQPGGTFTIRLTFPAGP